MAAKANIKRQREEQLYAQGLTVTQIAEWFRVSHQAVSKQLKLKANPELRRKHGAHYDLDEELRAGEDGPRMRERVRELYAQGLAIDFIVEQLGRPRQAVAEMIEGDAELGRQHAARVALDRKLIGGEPVTADDVSVDHRDGLPEDRGDAGSRSATRSATEERPAPQARNASEERREVQPNDPAGGGGHENDSGGEPAVNGVPAAEADAQAAERRRATKEATRVAEDPRNATKEQPEVQPDHPDGRRRAAAGDDRGDAAESQPATPRLTAENQPAPKSQPVRIPTESQPPSESEAAAERAEQIVRRVIELVSAAYRPNPNRSTPFTRRDRTAPPERWVAMFIASTVTNLSSVQLGEIFGCHSSTVRLAVSEITPIFFVDHTLREGILGIKAQIRV